MTTIPSHFVKTAMSVYGFQLLGYLWYKYPAFGALEITELPHGWSGTCRQNGTVQVSPDFYEQYPDNLARLVAHEIGHLLYRALPKRTVESWNSLEKAIPDEPIDDDRLGDGYEYHEFMEESFCDAFSSSLGYVEAHPLGEMAYSLIKAGINGNELYSTIQLLQEHQLIS